jgi:hypothetical protein
LHHPLAPRPISTDKAAMAQITSREELREWFNKHSHADWMQVIAARAALRALPYAIVEAKQKWLTVVALVLFRAGFISWAARSFPAHSMLISLAKANSAIYDAFDEEPEFPGSYIGDAVRASVAQATRAAAEMNPIHFAILAADSAAVNGGEMFWSNANHDCVLLQEQDISSAGSLLEEGLWLAGESKEWRDVWSAAKTLLAVLKDKEGHNQHYQVWIDWYNRRIEGHEAAFDIPGDIDRIHDKAILARLADATNEDFWGKGATYVNTTLQRWIDEAREQAAIDYVASGAPLNLGSEAELAARGELLTHFGVLEAELAKAQDQLVSLSETGHGGMGHNQPDHAPSLLQEEMALLRQRVVELETTVAAMATAFAKLNSAVPVANAIVAEPAQLQAKEAVAELFENAPKLNLWGRMMQPLEDATSPEVRKGFDNAAGVTLVAAIVGTPYYIYTTLPNAIAEFLHYLFTVWFPILPG